MTEPAPTDVVATINPPVAQVNQRFGTSFRRFEPTPENEAKDVYQRYLELDAARSR